MPRNVRNFWLTFDIDGRSSEFAAGPARADGGFSGRILLRDRGDIGPTLRIEGIAAADGTLEIVIHAPEGATFDGRTLTVTTRRD